jgi:hypothetical protein
MPFAVIFKGAWGKVRSWDFFNILLRNCNKNPNFHREGAKNAKKDMVSLDLL